MRCMDSIASIGGCDDKDGDRKDLVSMSHVAEVGAQ